MGIATFTLTGILRDFHFRAISHIDGPVVKPGSVLLAARSSMPQRPSDRWPSIIPGKALQAYPIGYLSRCRCFQVVYLLIAEEHKTQIPVLIAGSQRIELLLRSIGTRIQAHIDPFSRRQVCPATSIPLIRNNSAERLSFIQKLIRPREHPEVLRPDSTLHTARPGCC